MDFFNIFILMKSFKKSPFFYNNIKKKLNIKISLVGNFHKQHRISLQMVLLNCNMGISLLLELAVGIDRLLAVVEAVVEVVQECLEVAELDKLPVEEEVAEVDMLLVVGADKEVVEVAEEVGLDISLVAEDLSAFLKIAS
jgi:hypothetical protein